MLLIPSLELKGGKCVRKPPAVPSAKPAKAHETVAYADDPVAEASRWVKAGARRLHIVDLDSLTFGKPVHAPVVQRIVAACPGVPVQVAGGMRSEEAVLAYIEAGADFVVLGMRALTSAHLVNDLCLEYPGHIVVAMDVKDGKVATEGGWSKLADADMSEAAEHFQREGVAAIVFCAVGADPKSYVESAAALGRRITTPVIAAGGVDKLEDVKSLCASAGEDLFGVLVSEPLHDGFDLAAAQKLADSLAKP
ncbi:MAG TPA: HisA/HisF-related TIM barrel protein [Gammaproteobacteria bacterium]|nr:HisA/HisF-related TIM barrel protein [Gammaproteobacteria bacterium]